MRSNSIPEHPAILNALLTGYPDGKAHDGVECPICRQEAQTLYISAITKEIIGCDNCAFEEDAQMWAEEHL